VRDELMGGKGGPGDHKAHESRGPPKNPTRGGVGDPKNKKHKTRFFSKKKPPPPPLYAGRDWTALPLGEIGGETERPGTVQPETH